MDKRTIRLKCVDISNQAASRLGITFTGRDNEPFIERAKTLIEYVSESGADVEVRLLCAEVALKTVTRRGYMNESLMMMMKAVEAFVLEESPKKEEASVKPSGYIKKADRKEEAVAETKGPSTSK